MDKEGIVAHLKIERERLDRAIAALQGAGTTAANSRHKGNKKRRLTAAGRKRLSDSMKARWAARKKKGKTTLA